MKKILCIILSILMFTSMLSGLNMVAYAEDEFDDSVDYEGLYSFNSSNYCYYQICDNGTPTNSNDDYAEIVRFDDSSLSTAKTSYTIPATLGGYSVTSVGPDAFTNNTNLTSIKFGENVENVDARAFRGCTALAKFSISSSNDSGLAVSSYVLFANSSKKLVAFPPAKASSYTVPNTVTEIGPNAFCASEKIATVKFATSSSKYKIATIGENAFYGCTALTSITLPTTVTTINSGAFEGCSTLEEISVPTSVTTLESRAFAYCEALTSFTLPSSITVVKESLLEGCMSLESLTLHSGVTSIEKRAFAYCMGLSSFSFPSKVTTISEGMFEGCSGMGNLTIPSQITSIEPRAFAGCESFTKFTIPSFMTTISDGLLEGCTGITSMTIPSTVNAIGSGAFAYCSGLTKITIPNTVTQIGDGAFEGCSGATTLSIGTGVSKLGLGAFAYCESLTTVTVPANVKYIGEFAFEGCLALEIITLKEGIETIGSQAFAYCDALESLSIPASVSSIGVSICDLCYSLSTITVSSSNPYYTATNNILFNKDKTTLIYYPMNNSSSSYSIPSTVTTLASSCFSKNPYLTSVTIGSKVKVIEASAFSMCENLETIKFSTSIERIGTDAFSDTLWYANQDEGLLYINNILYKYIGDTFPSTISVASGTTRIEEGALSGGAEITKVTIPNSVTSIGNNAFDGCELLATLSIGTGVTSIGNNAFSNCLSLKSVTLPSKLQTIGSQAFYGCVLVTSVTIPATVTEIGKNAFQACAALTSISVNSSNTEYCSVDGVLYDKAMERLIQYPVGNTSTSFEIPKGVKVIAAGSFSGVAYLTDVTIPTTVTTFEVAQNTGSTDEAEDKADTFLNEANAITIHAYEDTPAHAYALENGLTFVALIVTGQIVNESGSIKYLYSNDKYAYGWIEDNGKQYYFGEDACALVGYKLVEAAVYNFNTSGVMTEKCGDLGDSNCDGYINVKDVTELQKIAAGLISRDEKIDLLSNVTGDVDANGDNVVDIRDASTVQGLLARLITKFPAAK